MKYIPYGKQHIDAVDIAEVAGILKSDWITQGPKIGEFERALAGYCGVKYAVAVSSGTAALHLACLAADLKKGEEAITTPITFLATANSIFFTGARPVFADIEYETVNINPQRVCEKINKKTKAILPVHFAGLPCDMEKIAVPAKENKLIVIEDACHALGAEYDSGGKWFKVGSCQHSDMTVFSFHPIKTITTGEGGAITTNSVRFYKRLLALRNHGIYKDKKTIAKGAWYYEMRDMGFNYRITDFQCSLGLSQLRKIGGFLKKRGKIASIYNNEFKELEGLIRLPNQYCAGKKHALHLYLLRLNLKRLTCSRKNIFDELQRKGIMVNVHYIPIFKQPFYRRNGYGRVECPFSEKYYDETLSLPIYPDLETRQLEYIIRTVKDVLWYAAK